MARRARARRATSTRPTPTTSSASTRKRAPLSSTPRSPRPAPRSRPGRARRRRSATTFSRASPARSRRGAKNSASCWRAKKARRCPKAIGEVGRAAQIFDFFAGEALRIPGEKFASVRPGVDIEVTREAVGVVGIIAPWNFPIAIPAWKIAPALCYGNCVVFKPADLVPGSAHALAEIIVRAGVPKGVFNLVMGRGSVGRPGDARTSSRRRDHLHRLGRRPGARWRPPALCAMRKFQLEMGGKNPLVVLDDADLKTAVECAVNGAYFSTGQRCTASSRLIVTQGIYARFAEALAERMRALVVDDARKPGAHIGPGRRSDPARSGPRLRPHRPGRGRQARARRRAAQSRHAGVLHGAGAVRRRRQCECASPARRSSAPSRR